MCPLYRFMDMVRIKTYDARYPLSPQYQVALVRWSKYNIVWEYKLRDSSGRYVGPFDEDHLVPDVFEMNIANQSNIIDTTSF